MYSPPLQQRILTPLSSAFGIAPRNIGTAESFTNKTHTPTVSDTVIPGSAPLCDIIAVKRFFFNDFKNTLLSPNSLHIMDFSRVVL